MSDAFSAWLTILTKVLDLVFSNVLTVFIFGLLIVDIFISVVGAVFDKNGERKDGK